MTGYIKKYYGDDSYFPDSARKRHNRYIEDHQEIMIFNFGGGGCGTPYGVNMGCHHSNTFWGGFGHGFGLGIANLLSGFGMGLMGFCSPMLNMFSGFGMPFMNMPMWGNFMPYSGLGFGGTSNSSGDTQKTDDTPAPTPTPSAAEAAKNEVEAELDKINKNNPEQNQLQNALNKLEAKKGELDSDYYNEKRMEILQSAKDKNLKLKDSSGNNINLGDELIPSDWNVDPLNTLNSDKIKKLQGLGVKPIKVGEQWCLSLPACDKINAASLIDLLGDIPIALAQNTGNTVNDNWIVGTINQGSITDNSDKNVSFDIDCSKFAASSYKYTYTVKQNGNNWTISYKSGYKSDDRTLYHKSNGNYKYESGKLVTDSDPIISKNKKEGYTQLTEQKNSQ